MLGKCLVKIGAKILTVALISIMAVLPCFAPTASSAAPVTATGIMIPLYTYPGSTWTAVLQARAAYPNVPIVAIINPDSGPGASQDPNYVSGIQEMQSVGIIVLGYVFTSYGSRSISSVEADINSYSSWYHVNGIFFDEMSNVQGYETYYSSLNSYVKSLGMTLTVGNPGASVPSTYIGTLDTLVIYENGGLPSVSSISSLYSGYNRNNFGVIAYEVSEPGQTYISSITNYLGYVYFTNASPPNPYDVLPSYFDSEIAILSAGVSTMTATTSTPTSAATITTGTTSTSQSISSPESGVLPITITVDSVDEWKCAFRPLDQCPAWRQRRGYGLHSTHIWSHLW